MKQKDFHCWSAVMLLTMTLSAQAAEKPANPAPAPERSVFIMPANPLQGRDPFFPNSSRPYEEANAGRKTTNVSSLTIKGFVGTGPDRMVIINNHTFAPGDEGDVSTSQGRMHIRCVEVSNDHVVVEVDGQRHELTFHDNL